MEEIKRLKNILLLSIVVVIFSAAGTRLYIELNQHETETQKTINKQLSTVELIFANKLNNLDAFYTTQLNAILSESEMLRAIALKDRKKLLWQLQPVFALLKQSNPHLTVFHIHDSDNRSLVRFHKPDVYGDKVYDIRNMLQAAYTSRTTQYGLEAGMFDGNHLTYRIVTPIFQNDIYYGIIEVGVALDKMVPAITETINQAIGESNHLRIAFYVNNDVIAFKNPDEYLRIGHSSIPIYNADVVDILRRVDFSAPTNQSLEYGSQTLMIYQDRIPITDHRGNTIAGAIILLDVTGFNRQKALLLKEGLMKPAIVITILFTLVLLFFNKILKRFGQIKHTIESNYTRIKSILDAQSDMMMISNGDRLIEANAAFLEFFEFPTLDAFLNEHDCICDFFEYEADKPFIQPEMEGMKWSKFIQRYSTLTHKVKIKGHIFAIHIDGYLSENSKREFIIVLNDITAIEMHQEQLHHLAYVDTLTELPNRADFINTLRQTLIEEATPQQTFALMFLDLDSFKQVNDVYGHNVGDMLLKKASSRILSVLEDQHYLARLGGDEFVVFVHRFHSKAQLSSLADQIIRVLNEEYYCENRRLHVGVSIGIALYPNHANDVTSLLKSADIAMYRAKEQGKNKYEFYVDGMDEEMYRHQEIEDDLKSALSNHELYLVYQPQVDTVTGRLIGVEALIRWHHPTKGDLYPNQFIPVAEKSALIIQIGEFVLSQAIRELGGLIRRYGFRLSLNTTTRELDLRNFVQKTIDICRLHDFDMHFLEIEFIERDALIDITHTQRIIHQLRQEGVQFALDDFGTGYSSLSYINRLSVDKLKIDKSFIENIFAQSNQLAIVKSIIAIAENINIRVVAEGVERLEEYNVLKSLGCDIIQGYYVAKPMKVEELDAFVERSFSDILSTR